MTATLEISTPSSRRCKPRYLTRRRNRPSFGDAIVKVARALGTPLMPWQTEFAMVAGELLPDGRPAYREVFVTVPRQQGKTLLLVCWMLHRCLSWDSPQLCAYTAQTGKAARHKILDEVGPQLYGSPFKQAIRKIDRSNGDEAIRFVNGSMLRVEPTSEEAGHGATWKFAAHDEIWADPDNRREAAFAPAMIRVPDAQTFICSTAGHAGSTFYNQKVAQGRQAVADDTGEGMCYGEWSAPDGFDPYDESRWAEWMPGVDDGVIPISVIRHELRPENLEEWIRAYGNKPIAGVDLIFPTNVWRAVVDGTAAAHGRYSFGVDVSEDRNSAAVVVYGDGVFELAEQRSGSPDWIVDYLNGLTVPGEVSIDMGGPAGAYASKIKRARPVAGREYQQACARLYDAVVQTGVKFRDDPRFTDAVQGAGRRTHGDTWSWSRRSSTADITPLVAATLAYDGSSPSRMIENVW